MSQLHILLIEDNDEHAAIISRHLRQVEDTRIVLSRASCLADGLAALAANRFDALLLDLVLPDSPIEHTLSRTLGHVAELPIIVISTIEERSLARQALKEGAQDYLCKANLSSELLSRAIDYAIERQTTEKRTRALATELNLAEQRERKRIATELHDHLAQLLVLGKYKLGQAKRIPSLGTQCADLLSEMDELLSQSLSYTRTLVANLSPSVLYESGFPAAIKWLAEQMQHYGLIVQVELPEPSPMTLPEDQAVLLFQSVRELLMNSVKHAKSSEAKIVLEYQREVLRVEVRDQGIGFNVAALADARSSPKFGLFSIRERMKALGGSFHLHSQPEKGTIAILTLRVLPASMVT